VTNEAFAICWRRLDDVPAAAAARWLFVVARNLLLERGRAAHRAQDQQRRARAGAPTAARDPADGLAERDAIVRAFLTLPERDREALRLTAWDGLAFSEAARVAGTTRAAFAMRVHRARRSLASALKAEEPSAPARRHPTPEPAP